MFEKLSEKRLARFIDPIKRTQHLSRLKRVRVLLYLGLVFEIIFMAICSSVTEVFPSILLLLILCVGIDNEISLLTVVELIGKNKFIESGAAPYAPQGRTGEH